MKKIAKIEITDRIGNLETMMVFVDDHNFLSYRLCTKTDRIPLSMSNLQIGLDGEGYDLPARWGKYDREGLVAAITSSVNSGVHIVVNSILY